MQIIKPLSPLHFLSEQPILQNVIYNNHVKHGEERPMNEFRNAMRDFARNYLQSFFASNGKELNESEIMEFEKTYYGEL